MNPMAFPFALFGLLCPINSVIGHKSVGGACEIRREIVFTVRNRGRAKISC